MLKVKDRIFQELDRLQYAPSDRLLLVEHLPIGLGGQITKKIDALCLAIAFQRKAIFEHIDQPPYHQLFVPLSDQKFPTTTSGLSRIDVNLNQSASVVVLDKTSVAVRDSNGSLTPKIRELIITRLGIKVDEKVVEGHIIEWMKVVPWINQEAQNALNRLGVDKSTLGVHFRRGDKTVEHAYVPASAFNEKIAQRLRTGRFNKVFVASDSPLALKELEFPSGVQVIFDDREIRYNNANHKMVRDSEELAKQETFVAFKNIYLLSKCAGLVGQDNAHFATIAAAAIVSENYNNKDDIVLIPGDYAERKSRLLKRYFDVKRSLRKRVKKSLKLLKLIK